MIQYIEVPQHVQRLTRAAEKQGNRPNIISLVRLSKSATKCKLVTARHLSGVTTPQMPLSPTTNMSATHECGSSKPKRKFLHTAKGVKIGGSDDER